MNSIGKILLAIGSILVLSNCNKSSSDSGTPTAENLLTSTFAAINTQAAKVTKISDSDLTTASIQSQDVELLAAPSFGAAWATTALMNNIITNSGNITSKVYMGHQLNSSAKSSNGSDINVFGRMKTGLGIFCAIGIAADKLSIPLDSNRYPSDGEHSIAFSADIKSAMNTTCGVSPDNIPDGTVMKMTVSSIAGNYDKKIVFDLFNQVYLVKANSSIVNITSVEQNGSGQISRTVIAWDRTTNLMRVEYVANPATATSTGMYAYRLYFDETNDVGQIMVYEGNDSALAQSTRYVLAGKPNTGDAFSLSMKTLNVESGAKVEACILSANGNIETDGVRCTASSTRSNGAAIDSLDSLFTAFFAQKTATTWFSSASETTGLGWSTTTDMLTAAIVP